MRVFQKSDLDLSLYPNILVLKTSVLYGLSTYIVQYHFILAYLNVISVKLFKSPKITVFSFCFVFFL